MAKPGIECFRDKRVVPLGTPDRLGDRYLARRGFACSLEQSFRSFHLVGRSHDWIPVPARADRHGSLLVIARDPSTTTEGLVALDGYSPVVTGLRYQHGTAERGKASALLPG